MGEVKAAKPDLDHALYLHRTGRSREARQIYERLLRLYPRNPELMHLLGVATMDAGDVNSAITWMTKAAQKLHNNPSLANNLGNAYRLAGREAKARMQYRIALRIDEGFATAHCNLAILNLETGYLADALDGFRRAIAIDESLFEAGLGLSNVYRIRREFDLELVTLQKTLDLRPADVGVQNQLIVSLAENGLKQNAKAAIRAAIDLRPNDLDTLRSCARSLQIQGCYEESVRLYRRAAALPKASAEVLNEFGRSARVLGLFDESIAAFKSALNRDPKSWDAMRNLALLDEPLSDKSMFILKKSAHHSTSDSTIAGFTLGHILDKRGRFDEAMTAYARANRLLKQSQVSRGLVFDRRLLEAQVEKIVSKDSLAVETVSSTSERPIFLVGMPRSGSSLIEQILSSHPLVHGRGERKALGALWHAHETGICNDAHLDNYLTDDVVTSDGPSRSIDKMLDNIFMLEAVAVRFPNARVIYCDRNPHDIVLSCFFQFWPDTNYFATDLMDCAYRVFQVLKLRDYWCRVFGDRFLSVRYETLVSELEKQAKNIVSFIGMPWNECCLSFDRTKRPIATASGWQVRQPLFFSSVNRSNHYKQYLADIDVFFKAVGAE